MTSRTTFTLVTITVVGGLLLACADTAMTQSQEVPRTPWGHPDLTGIWTNSTVTPIERPDELGDKEFFTEEEFAEMAGLDIGESDVFFLEIGGPVKTRRTSLVIDPPSGKVPALTPQAQALFGEQHTYSEANPYDGPENLDNTSRCMHFGGSGPPIFPEPYANRYQIFQTEDHFVLLTEMNHVSRIIRLNDRPALPSDILQWEGDSRGRWEGDTLVAETTNLDFNAMSRYGVMYDSIADENLKVTERFTRTDAETIMYQATVENPGVFTAPWTIEMPFRADPGPIVEFACHEGNYGMTNILSGARIEEAAGIEVSLDRTIIDELIEENVE